MTGFEDPRFETRGPGHTQQVQIGAYGASVADRLDEWLRGGNLQRFWNRDASIWSGAKFSIHADGNNRHEPCEYLYERPMKKP